MALAAGWTYAYLLLLGLDANLFIIASIFYILSVLTWLISWAYLIKKSDSVSYRALLGLGFASLYGALSPAQLGAEALRSLRLKEFYGVRYADSVSASLVAKGSKFLILALVALLSLLYFLNTKTDPVFFFGFLSGLIVVVLIAILFLLPLQPRAALGFQRSLEKLSSPLPLLAPVAKFFVHYSERLHRMRSEEFFLVLFLSALSWAFEFFALQYTFFSLGIVLSFHSLLVLMTMISVLERTPLLPRGIGLVEVVAWHFLAFPELIAGITLTAAQIVAVLALYDFVRLVIPTLLSVAWWLCVQRRVQRPIQDSLKIQNGLKK